MHHVIGLKQTRGIKNVTLKAAKKICGCRGLLGRVIRATSCRFQFVVLKINRGLCCVTLTEISARFWGSSIAVLQFCIFIFVSFSPPFQFVASKLSLPSCRFHLSCRFQVATSKLSPLPRCHFHVVASTFSVASTLSLPRSVWLPRCRFSRFRFQVVAFTCSRLMSCCAWGMFGIEKRL